MRPRKVRDFVVFSGTSALWVLGKVLKPSFGTAYIKKDDLEKLKRIGIKREGYPIRFYSYDEDIFNYTITIRGYKLPVIEQIIADTLGGYIREPSKNCWRRWRVEEVVVRSWDNPIIRESYERKNHNPKRFNKINLKNIHQSYQNR